MQKTIKYHLLFIFYTLSILIAYLINNKYVNLINILLSMMIALYIYKQYIDNNIYLNIDKIFNYIKTDSVDRDEIIYQIESESNRILGNKIIFINNYKNHSIIDLIYKKSVENNLGKKDIINAETAYKKNKKIYTGSNKFSITKNWQWFPISDNDSVFGVIGINISIFKLNIIKKILDFILDQYVKTILKINDFEQNYITQESNYKLSMAILSSISHDLKTPLTSIIGSLSAIRYLGEKIDLSSRNLLIFEAEEEAMQLNRFISNLLNMIKLKSKEIELNLDWYNPNDIIKNVLSRLQFKKLNQIKYQENNDNFEIKVDSILIEQVLQNLIENAIKASPIDSPIFIKIFLNKSNESCIIVEDFGVGIPISIRKQVFNKFFSKQHFENQTPGNGLGLAICNTIIEAHNGRVTIDNRSNDYDYPGCIFTIIFPTEITKIDNKSII